MTSAAAPPVFDPLDPGFTADPYPHYARIRAENPVHTSPLGPVFVGGYADVVTILRDQSLHVHDSVRTQILREVLGPDTRLRRSLLDLDPPDHTRVRRLAQQAFTPKRVADLRARTQQLTDEHLDAAARDGEVDLISALAFPVPFLVISELLGMPDGDRAQIREWSHHLAGTLEPEFDPDRIRRSAEIADAFAEYASSVIADKRRAPGDDLLTALVHAEADDGVLGEDELISLVLLLYIAGHETTVNLIGNGTRALLAHRDQLDRWHADPSLDQNAVEELLRYDPPVQYSRRVTVAPYRVGEHEIEPGTFVVTGLACANRDEHRFGADAEHLDLGRVDAPHHVAFGSGIHHCLGAALARMEGQVALGTLVRRFPGIELAGEPVPNGRIVLRGLDALPVRLA